MKHSIEGFNQEEVIKMGNLDVIDLVILRWLVDFEPNMLKKEIDGEIYFWVNYQSLLEALPILDICKKTLYRRLEKMCNVEILKHKNVKDKGNYSYYAFGKNYKNLVTKMSEPLDTNVQTLGTQMSEQNNSSIKKYKEIKNNKLFFKESEKKFKKPTLEEIQNYCIERNNKIDAEQFINYYEANGWKVGRNPMKDWKATIRYWERNNKSSNEDYEEEHKLTQEDINNWIEYYKKGEATARDLEQRGITIPENVK